MLARFSMPRIRAAGRWLAVGLAGVVLVGGALFWLLRKEPKLHAEATGGRPSPPKLGAAADRPAAADGTIRLSRAQQQAIGLQTARVEYGPSADVLIATGRIAPDETSYAFITPRAAGVVRAVAAHIGQEVKAGDLLATIDSPEVAQARLELVTRKQEYELARYQANWQQEIFQTTAELIERLKAGDSPEEIHRRFADRPVGLNRERLLTAYADFRLDQQRLTRHEQLRSSDAVSQAALQQVRAEYEAAQAVYQALMDRTGFETKLDNDKAQQLRRQAETAVRVAQERLRVLGVRPDGTEPEVRHGKVVGVKADGTLPASDRAKPEDVKPEEILPEPSKDAAPVDPVGSQADEQPVESVAKQAPISTYSIWAPFDGVILDRELIVPGIFVDTTHRIFTMANLSRVWIEVHVHESDFGMLSRSRDAGVSLTTPAYPGRSFRGEVIYTGDLVDEKTRRVLLLARADNPERLLKPGMFVSVRLEVKGERSAARVPGTAILTEGGRHLVFVRTGPETFARREVEVGPADGRLVAVKRGLAAGDEVVTEGAFKVKARALALASDGG